MEKRGRKPGTPKTGGRTKGQPNAITCDLRSFYTKLIDDNRQEIIIRLKRLDDVSFFQALDRINKYILPTLSSVSQEVEITSKLNQLNDQQLDELITQIIEKQEDGSE